jgi:hypothetical protein
MGIYSKLGSIYSRLISELMYSKVVLCLSIYLSADPSGRAV